MSYDPNAFLMGAGAPSVKFPELGTTVKGTVEDMEVTQQTDINGNLKTWADGSPMMQLVVTLATDERDAAVTNDDGKRRLFVKGQMLAAVRAAVKQAGSQLLAGGTLVVKWAAEEPPKQRGFNPTKIYEAAYRPPANTGVDDLLDASPQPATATAGPSASDLI